MLPIVILWYIFFGLIFFLVRNSFFQLLLFGEYAHLIGVMCIKACDFIRTFKNNEWTHNFEVNFKYYGKSADNIIFDKLSHKYILYIRFIQKSGGAAFCPNVVVHLMVPRAFICHISQFIALHCMTRPNMWLFCSVCRASFQLWEDSW